MGAADAAHILASGVADGIGVGVHVSVGSAIAVAVAAGSISITSAVCAFFTRAYSGVNVPRNPSRTTFMPVEAAFLVPVT